jgi:DNA mismatch repair ATPase MutL
MQELELTGARSKDLISAQQSEDSTLQAPSSATSTKASSKKSKKSKKSKSKTKSQKGKKGKSKDKLKGKKSKSSVKSKKSKKSKSKGSVKSKKSKKSKSKESTKSKKSKKSKSKSSTKSKKSKKSKSKGSVKSKKSKNKKKKGKSKTDASSMASEKYRSAYMRKRGELVLPSLEEIDDYPTKGPHLYVVLQGFYNPIILQELLNIGVNVDGIMMLTDQEIKKRNFTIADIEDSIPGTFRPKNILPNYLKYVEQQSQEQDVVQQFWVDFADMFNVLPDNSCLLDVALLNLKLPKVKLQY